MSMSKKNYQGFRKYIRKIWLKCEKTSKISNNLILILENFFNKAKHEYALNLLPLILKINKETFIKY